MNTTRILAVGLLLAPLLPQTATAQLLDPSFNAPTGLYASGAVYCLGPQQADGKRLVSGVFNSLNGLPARNLVRIDASGAPDTAFQRNVGFVTNPIYRIIIQPNGQYLLSSRIGLAVAGGISRQQLLRLNANGTADATFDPGLGASRQNNPTNCNDFAVQPDGKVLVVGPFDSFNGVPAAGVVRLNPNGSVDPSFSVGTGSNAFGQLNAVALQPDGKILVGGNFSTFNGQPAPCVVRLNATGSLDPTFTFPHPGSVVESLLLQPDGKILATGTVSVSPTTPLLGLVRLLPSGARDPAFTVPSFIRRTFDLVTLYDHTIQLQADGKIILSGPFPGAGANRLVRLNTDGSQDLSFHTGTGPSEAPNTLGLQANGAVLAGGFFTSFNGVPSPFVQLTSSGAIDPAFRASVQIPGSIEAIIRQPDGQLLVGGNFTEVSGQRTNNLARFSDTGVMDLAFAGATRPLPAPVYCLALQPDGKVLAGTSSGVYRIAGTGSPDPSFSSFSTFLSASALAVQPDGKIMMSGGFSGSAGSGLFYGVVRLTSTGAIDPTFRNGNASPALGNPTYINSLLLQPDGRVVVGGSFPRVAGARCVVRYEATGALDPTFTPAAFTSSSGGPGAPTLLSLSRLSNGNILVGGRFNAVNGTSRSGVARLTATGTLDAGFVPDATLTGTVFSVVPQPNDRVLLGGRFTNATSTSTWLNLARVLDNGQTDNSFTPTASPDADVTSLLVQPDGLIVLGGYFKQVGGQAAFSLARIGAPNVLHVAAPAAVAARTSAWPVPAHDQLHVAPDFSARPSSVELLDALGRRVRQLPVSGRTELTLDVAQLPTGVYLLRVNYAAGSVSRRVAVQ